MEYVFFDDFGPLVEIVLIVVLQTGFSCLDHEWMDLPNLTA